jgi:hypothetical protein
MARDIDRFFFGSGFLSMSMSSLLFYLVDYIAGENPAFISFLTTWVLLNFMFLLGAVIVDSLGYTTKKPMITGICLVIIVASIYRVMVNSPGSASIAYLLSAGIAAVSFIAVLMVRKRWNF